MKFFDPLVRLWRYAWQFVIWFVVGMVCFHATLLLLGVSWNAILTFWVAMLGSFIGSHMAERFLTKRRQKKDDENSIVD